MKKKSKNIQIKVTKIESPQLTLAYGDYYFLISDYKNALDFFLKYKNITPSSQTEDPDSYLETKIGICKKHSSK